MVPLSNIEGLPARSGSEREEPPASGPEQSATPASKSEIEAKVVDMLKSCYDPEIPVDIYELGLIYKIDVDDDRNVEITMTLTAPACPVAETMPGMVESRVASIPEVNSARVELTFDPPWDKSMMSEAARFQLGFL